MHSLVILLIVLGVLLVTGIVYFKIEKRQILYSFIGIFVVWGSYILLRYANLSFGISVTILFCAIILFTIFFEDKIV